MVVRAMKALPDEYLLLVEREKKPPGHEVERRCF
jgi:uncharacterized protein (DUF3820 family)